MAVYGRLPQSRVSKFSSVQQTFVQNTGNVGGDPADLPATPADVANGEIVAFADGSPVDMSASTLSSFNEVVLVRGTAYEPILSVIHSKGVRTVKNEYAAPQTQVTEVDFGGDATEAEEITFKVINLEQGYEPFPRVNASLYLEGDETAADLAQRIADKINANERATVSVAVAGSVLTLTADEAGEVFEIGLTGKFFNDATVTVTNNPSTGNGSAESVKIAELATRGTYTRYNQEDNLLGSVDDPPTFADGSLNYDMFNVLHENDNDTAINRSFAYNQILIAVATGLDTANLENFLEI